MKRRAFLLGLSTLAPLAVSRVARAAPAPVVDRAFTIVLDPGHGGHNSGCSAHAGDHLEKDMTLDLAFALSRTLADVLPHARVLLTREGDDTLPIAERVAFANAVEADIFVSLHCNASPNRDQTGFETFVLDVNASSLDAARTAQRENDEGLADPGARDDVDAMVRELMLTSNRTRAGLLAQAIQAEQALRFPERPNRGVRQGPLNVLKGARMPAVLTEVGFLDHAEEGIWMQQPRNQTLIVEGLAQALATYYRRVHRQA